MANYTPPDRAESKHQGSSAPPRSRYSGSSLEHGQTAAGPPRGESTQSIARSSYQPPQHHVTSGSHHHTTAFPHSSYPSHHAQSAPHPPLPPTSAYNQSRTHPPQRQSSQRQSSQRQPPPQGQSSPPAHNEPVSHPPPSQLPQSQSKAPLTQWECKPPASRRIPPNLRNKGCGARYLGIGAVTANHHSLFEKAACSETMLFFELLTCIYFYRCNMISGPGTMPKDEIRELFDTGIASFKFALIEIYKRMLIRLGIIDSTQVNEFSWWGLPQWELDNLRQYIIAISKFTAEDGTVFKLFEIGADDNGTQWMRIIPGPITLAMIQLCNCIHDTIEMFKDLTNGSDYIKSTVNQVGFKYC